ncbi:TPA: MBL fold metallo-hydrolase [Legionella pneumophila]
MLTDTQMQQAINNLNVFIANYNSPLSCFSFENERVTRNWFFKSDATHTVVLSAYLKKIIDEVSSDEVDKTSRLYASLFITLQNFLHLQPNRVIEDLNLNLENKKYLKRKNLIISRLDHLHAENQFKDDLRRHLLPEIQYDMRTGHYTSPDDEKAHQHGSEAQRIFFSTQWERFKALCNWLLAKMGIHVFETARYKEHDYLDSEIYANDPAIEPEVTPQQKATHYWIGHASNLMTIPAHDSPLHVVTDPVEGDLAPFLYPRMTEEGCLIDGMGSKKLPKIDIVVISHNHHDHVSQSTLKRLVKQQPKMIVPEGDESFFIGMGFRDVVGLKWWEQAKITDFQGNELLRITAVPARHWSGRSLTDAHRSAFNGYVLHANQLEGDIYFAGDTALMDDMVSQPIFEKFNIVTSIQPGGPDERREDMESTHQSSADAILMHFKILAAQYQKMKEKNDNLSLDEFLMKNQHLKTLYNHTATFKLGNLRLKDTYYSYQRMVAAFREDAQWRVDHLPKHEQKVYDYIQLLMNRMIFKNNQRFNNQQIADLILGRVVIPKIGQRQPLYFNEKPTKARAFQYRDLITNRRALLEFDMLLQESIDQSNKLFNVKQLILNLLRAYQNPWHAFFSRTHLGVGDYEQDIRNCQSNSDLLNVLNRMERNLGNRNQHGHMQSLIYYAKWLIDVSNQHQHGTLMKFKEYFACQQVKKLADQEIHHTGGIVGFGDRQAKQQQFKVLSNQLADLPEDVTEYRKAIDNWLSTRVNDGQSTQQLLSENRSSVFAKKVTHGESTVLHIKTTLDLAVST